MMDRQHSWLVEVCIKGARRACDAGDAKAFAATVARLEFLASRWGAPVQQHEAQELRSKLEAVALLETAHGEGSALNLSNPSVARLILAGVYPEEEVRHAHAMTRSISHGHVVSQAESLQRT